jgi:hypothetical protein
MTACCHICFRRKNIIAISRSTQPIAERISTHGNTIRARASGLVRLGSSLPHAQGCTGPLGARVKKSDYILGKPMTDG